MVFYPLHIVFSALIMGVVGVVGVPLIRYLMSPIKQDFWSGYLLPQLMIIGGVLAIFVAIAVIITVVALIVDSIYKNKTTLVSSGTTFKWQNKRTNRLTKKVRVTTLDEFDVAEVTHITWHISPFSANETLRMTFWKGDPDLEWLFDFISRNKDAVELGEVRCPDLKASPEAHAALAAFLLPKIDNGEIISTVDVLALEALPDTEPPLPDCRQEGKSIVSS
jgi:hypothetical protein